MSKTKIDRTPLSGAESVAQAMRQINPEVVAAYPITPQTGIMHAFTAFVNDGDVDTEMIRVESEHSAMSATLGASAAGVRAMTATSSNGLALMHEIVYIAASTRLPIVMPVVNRALSGPINIHCDHSDTMAERDSGWVQIYCENNQEAYEMTLLAIRLAEHKDILLPVMVCQDGFITSHGVEGVKLYKDSIVKKFLGKYKPKHPLLDTKNPITIGPLDFYDYYFEHKRQQSEAIHNVRKVFPKLVKEFKKISGKDYGFIESYMMDDAKEAIVVMSSSAGTTKEVVDRLRKEGRKVGMVKIRMFRPFPISEIKEVLKGVDIVAVLDRVESFGAVGGPLFNEIRSSLYDYNNKPKIVNYVFGLGGRSYTPELGRQVFDEISKDKNSKDYEHNLVRYLGVRN